MIRLLKTYRILILVLLLYITGHQLNAQTVGPNNPGTGVNLNTTGTIAWATPGNILNTADLNYTTATFPASASTNYLVGTNYGFAIPAGAIVNGITVTISRKTSFATGGRVTKDNIVSLVKNGAITVTNKALPASYTTSFVTATYGSSTDTWGTTWTSADINATNFGAVLSVSANNNLTATVDYIKITIHYTTITFSPSSACTGSAASIVITGNNLIGTSAVSFNGTTASFIQDTNTQVTATLPVGATTGTISLTTPSGIGTSASNFTVNPLPTVASITGTTSVCVGSTTTLFDATPGGNWSSSSPLKATINASGVVSGVAGGTSLIIYTFTDGNGCSKSVNTTVTVNALPVVSAPSTVCIGSTIQLTPASSGSWVSSDGTKASVNNTNGLITGVALGSATFIFTDGNNCNATTSSVNVLALPAISAHPAVTQTVCSSSSVSFSLTATGSGISYQWYNGATLLSNGATILGANTPTLTINPVSLSDASSNYNCVVSGSCIPNATSNNAELIVLEKAIITSQPAATQIYCTGATANFSLTATGTGLTYQWYNGATPLVDSATINGATTSSLSISSLTMADASINYYCLVIGTSPCSAVSSSYSILNVNQSISITSNPAVSQTVCSFSSVSFTVSATGTALTYQWYNGATLLSNGGSISGANTATLTINPVSLSDASLNYKCVVSGSCTPNAFSNVAELIVLEKATITSQPAATQTYCTGDTVNFSVSATGTGLTYQWYNGATPLLDSATISGATTNTLTISSLSLADASNNYYCLVMGTSPCSAVASLFAILNMNQGPLVTSQPAVSQTVCSSGSVSFTVAGSGGSLIYQWYKGATLLSNGGTISGATSPTLILNPVSLSDAGTNYNCVITNGCSTGATSDNAELIVNEKVIITVQPAVTQTYCTGNSVNFSVTATGTGLTYQWYKGATLLVNTASIAGATTATLTLSSLTLSDAGNNYYCLVSGTSPCSAVASSFSILYVNQSIAITSHPAISQTVCEATSVSFTVAGAGTALTYQWYNGATLLSNGGAISGATAPTLTINPVSLSHASTTYRCVLSGSCTPNALSNNAELIVNPKGFIPNQTLTVCNQNAFTITPINGVPNAGTIIPSGTTYSWSAPSVSGGMTGGSAQSGQASIFGNLTNPTNTNQTATYNVTPSTGSFPSCNGATFTVTVTVKPSATVINQNTPACSTYSFTFTPTSGGGNIIPSGTLYSWGLPTVTGGVTGATAENGQASLIQTLTNPTGVAQTATYTIASDSNGCAGSPFTLVVTVNPKPIASVTIASQTTCSGVTFSNITLSNTINSTTTYNWTRDNTTNVSGTTIGASGTIASGGSFSLSGSLINNTTVAQTVIYTFTPVSNNCSGNSITSTVIVNAPSTGGAVTSSLQGILPAISNITECHFATGTLYLSNHVGNVVRWEYTTTGGSIWIPISNTTTTYTYINIAVSTFFRAVVQNGASCSLVNSSTTLVNVIPNIKPSPVTATPATICVGDSSDLFSQSGFATNALLQAGGSFSNANPANWLVDGCGNCLSAGASNTNPGPFQLSATNGGTYSGINYTSTGKFAIANGNFNSVLVTPVFNTFGLTSASLTFNHAFNLQAGAWASVELSLDGGATFTVVLAQYNGPSTRTPYTAFPLTSIDLSNYIGQANLKIRFNYHGTVNSSWAIDNIQIPEAPSNLTTEWIDSATSQVISTSATVTVTPSVTTTYAIVSHLNGCTSFGPNGTNYVTVTVNPRPTANIGPNQTICNGGTATFSVALTGSAPWTITYSNGTTTTTVNNVNTNPYVFSVSGITTNKTYTITALSDSKCNSKSQDLTGSAVVTVLNGTAGLWTGLTSTDWFDCRNWAGGLPSATVNAQIPSGAARMPLIDPATSSYAALYSNIARAQDIIIGNTATLNMGANSNLYVSRDWKDSGLFMGQGTVTFNGAAANQIQTINVGIRIKETFYNLIVNTSNTAKGVSLIDGFELTVANLLTLQSGDIRLTGEAQIVQNGLVGNPTTGTGKIYRDQQGTKSSFNYNYWSSPVSNNGTDYTVAGVLSDGSDVTTNPFSPTNINFGGAYNFADGAVTNPIKLSSYWMYKYTSVSTTYAGWQTLGSTGTVKIGEGFTMKGTDGIAPISDIQNYVFAGKPNNGNITLTISPNQTYLVGNPYPSAVDADEFIKDNIKDGGGRNTTNVINGALYFWNHFGGHSHNLGDYVGGYATYTLMGGVNAISNDALVNNNGAMGTLIARRYIPVGQGFFVGTSLAASLVANNPNLSTAITGGPILFKNSQRVFKVESYSNSVFMRSQNNVPVTTQDMRPKIKLRFDSPTGLHRQLLVGADSSATDLFDLGYDAPIVDANANDMFWDVSGSKFVIQAIANFNSNRVIPLTIKISNPGIVTVKLDTLENIPEDTQIYLFDNFTEIYHDLRDGSFTATLTAGLHNKRFSLRFAAEFSKIAGNVANNDITINFTNNNNTLNITNNDSKTIFENVYLYNLLGQKVGNWELENQPNIQIPIQKIAQGTYIVKVKTSNGIMSTKIIIE